MMIANFQFNAKQSEGFIMKSSGIGLVLAVGLAAICSSGAQAQSAVPTPPPPPPAPRPPLALAVEAAQEAVAVCAANGYRATVVVIDAAAAPVVMLSADGAPERAQQVAFSKAYTSIKFGMASGDVADRIKTDPTLAAQVAADPKIGTPRRGGLLLRSHGDIVGAIGVTGAPRGDRDEICTKAGADRIAGRL
jgi:uncharacterized protein GlcG (DUF336 family)